MQRTETCLAGGNDTPKCEQLSNSLTSCPGLQVSRKVVHFVLILFWNRSKILLNNTLIFHSFFFVFFSRPKHHKEGNSNKMKPQERIRKRKTSLNQTMKSWQFRSPQGLKYVFAPSLVWCRCGFLRHGLTLASESKISAASVSNSFPASKEFNSLPGW